MKIKSLCVALILIGLIGPVCAAEEAGASAGKIRQVQQEKRKLEQEKNQLASEKATLDGQLKDAQTSLDSVQKKADSFSHKTVMLEKDLAQSREEKSALETKLAELEKQLAESKIKLAEAAILRGKLESDRGQLETNVTERDQALSSCINKNQQSYQTGLELLDKYQKKSCFTSLLQREPFTGLEQTKIENQVARGRDELDKSHIITAR